MGWFVHLKSNGEDPGCQGTRVQEALFLCELSSGHHSLNLHCNWCPGLGPSGNPPSPQATARVLRSRPEKADSRPASDCQKTKHLISNICVLCEEIYKEKKKGSHADTPGSVSPKVIPFVALRSPEMLAEVSQILIKSLP